MKVLQTRWWYFRRRLPDKAPPYAALFATYSYHGFITDRDGETLELEADHRRHAEIENAIRRSTPAGCRVKPCGA